MTTSSFQTGGTQFPWIQKDPNAALDYTVDWTDWLATISATISAVVWTVPAGLTLASQANTTTTATVFLSGGTPGTDYDVSCKITPTGATRAEERTFTVRVVQR